MSDDVDPPASEMVFHWRKISDYTPGRLVLLRGADRSVLGFSEAGAWFQMVDGEDYALNDFQPVEWCEPPGGPAAWD